LFWQENTKFIVDFCTDYDWGKDLFLNSIFNKGSFMSSLVPGNRFWLTNLSKLDVAGMIFVIRECNLSLCFCAEAILQTLVNMDVALTIYNSFNRRIYLERLTLYGRVTLGVMILFHIVILAVILTHLEYYHQMYPDLGIIMLTFNRLSLLWHFLLVPSTLSIVFATVMTAKEIWKIRHQLRDKRHVILRKQILYFVVVNFTEFPFQVLTYLYITVYKNHPVDL
jgi:hypothetical protein